MLQDFCESFSQILWEIARRVCLICSPFNQTPFNRIVEWFAYWNTFQNRFLYSVRKPLAYINNPVELENFVWRIVYSTKRDWLNHYCVLGKKCYSIFVDTIITWRTLALARKSSDFVEEVYPFQGKYFSSSNGGKSRWKILFFNDFFDVRSWKGHEKSFRYNPFGYFMLPNVVRLSQMIQRNSENFVGWIGMHFKKSLE